jgi:uncharacterized protein (TIGR00251 family)
MSINETKDGILITVFVKPNSPEFKIELDGNEIIVYSTEEPEKGKVNKEIIKELSRFFKSKVEMISGFTSKQKQLIVKGMDKNQVEAILKSLIGKT